QHFGGFPGSAVQQRPHFSQAHSRTAIRVYIVRPGVTMQRKTGAGWAADSARHFAQKKSPCPHFSSCVASNRTCPSVVNVFLTVRKLCQTIWSSVLPLTMTVSGRRHLRSSRRRFVCAAIVSFVCWVNVIPSTLPGKRRAIVSKIGIPIPVLSTHSRWTWG